MKKGAGRRSHGAAGSMALSLAALPACSVTCSSVSTALCLSFPICSRRLRSLLLRAVVHVKQADPLTSLKAVWGSQCVPATVSSGHEGLWFLLSPFCSSSSSCQEVKSLRLLVQSCSWQPSRTSYLSPSHVLDPAMCRCWRGCGDKGEQDPWVDRPGCQGQASCCPERLQGSR